MFENVGVTRELGLIGPWGEKPRGHSSVGRAPALQAGCQGFESPCLHQRNGRVAQLVRARP